MSDCVYITLNDGITLYTATSTALQSSLLRNLIDLARDGGSDAAVVIQLHNVDARQWRLIEPLMATLAQTKTQDADGFYDAAVLWRRDDVGAASLWLEHGVTFQVPTPLMAALGTLRLDADGLVALAAAADHLDVPAVLQTCVGLIASTCRWRETNQAGSFVEDLRLFFDLFTQPTGASHCPFARLSPLVVDMVSMQLTDKDVCHMAQFFPGARALFGTRLAALHLSSPRCMTQFVRTRRLVIDDGQLPCTSVDNTDEEPTLLCRGDCRCERMHLCDLFGLHQAVTHIEVLCSTTWLPRLLSFMKHIDTVTLHVGDTAVVNALCDCEHIKHVTLMGKAVTVDVFRALTALTHPCLLTSINATESGTLMITRVNRPRDPAMPNIIVDGMSWQHWGTTLNYDNAVGSGNDDDDGDDWLATDAVMTVPPVATVLVSILKGSNTANAARGVLLCETLTTCLRRYGVERMAQAVERSMQLRDALRAAAAVMALPLPDDISALYKTPLLALAYARELDKRADASCLSPFTPASTFSLTLNGRLYTGLNLERAVEACRDEDKTLKNYTDLHRLSWKAAMASPEGLDHVGGTWLHQPAVCMRILDEVTQVYAKQNYSPTFHAWQDATATLAPHPRALSWWKAFLERANVRNALGLTPVQVVMVCCRNPWFLFGECGKSLFTPDLLAWYLNRQTPLRAGGGDATPKFMPPNDERAFYMAVLRDSSPRSLAAWRDRDTGDNLLHVLMRHLRWRRLVEQPTACEMLVHTALCRLANVPNRRGVTPLDLCTDDFFGAGQSIAVKVLIDVADIADIDPAWDDLRHKFDAQQGQQANDTQAMLNCFNYVRCIAQVRSWTQRQLIDILHRWINYYSTSFKDPIVTQGFRIALMRALANPRQLQGIANAEYARLTELVTRPCGALCHMATGRSFGVASRCVIL